MAAEACRPTSWSTAERGSGPAPLGEREAPTDVVRSHPLRRPDDPLEAPPIRALKLAAVQQPDDEELNEQIRVLDRQLREEWQQRQRVSY